MATASHRLDRRLHPIPSVLLGAALVLFLGALLSDWAYSATFEVQWVNFAAWLIAGALVVVGGALLWAVIDALRSDAPKGRAKWLYVGLLAITFVLGFINALVHAKDAWATMPSGAILSILTFLLAVAAAWVGFAAPSRLNAR